MGPNRSQEAAQLLLGEVRQFMDAKPLGGNFLGAL